MNELLLQALATFSAKLTDNDKLAAKFEPESGQPDDKLDQSYKCSKTGGEYTDGAGHVVKGFSVFSADIARYGEVIDGFTDWHGKYEAAVPPFAALVVRPKDDVRETHSTLYRLSQLKVKCCPTPAGKCCPPRPHACLARIYLDAGLDQRCRILSHSL